LTVLSSQAISESNKLAVKVKPTGLTRLANVLRIGMRDVKEVVEIGIRVGVLLFA
jgi:hypothetical protein